MLLTHAPGEAQADFGEAMVVIAGVEQKAYSKNGTTVLSSLFGGAVLACGNQSEKLWFQEGGTQIGDSWTNRFTVSRTGGRGVPWLRFKAKEEIRANRTRTVRNKEIPDEVLFSTADAVLLQ